MYLWKGDKDQELFRYVLNCTGTDELNWGIGRLYCHARGWEFHKGGVEGKHFHFGCLLLSILLKSLWAIVVKSLFVDIRITAVY